MNTFAHLCWVFGWQIMIHIWQILSPLACDTCVALGLRRRQRLYDVKNWPYIRDGLTTSNRHPGAAAIGMQVFYQFGISVFAIFWIVRNVSSLEWVTDETNSHKCIRIQKTKRTSKDGDCKTARISETYMNYTRFRIHDPRFCPAKIDYSLRT